MTKLGPTVNTCPHFPQFINMTESCVFLFLTNYMALTSTKKG